MTAPLITYWSERPPSNGRDIWRKIPPLIRHGIFLLEKKFHLMEKNASHFFVYRLATCGKYLTYGFCKTDTRRNNEDDDNRQL